MNANTETVRTICETAIAEKGFGENYSERLKFEIGELAKYDANKVGDKAGDLLRRRKKPPVDTNASGSLVLYLLGISTLDPIATGLEPDRKSIVTGDCPDIDLDFMPGIREWVKAHVREVFGEKHVCSIGTYQSFKTKAVIVDVARVLGLDVKEAMEVTKPLDVVFDEEEDDWLKIDKMDFDELGRHFPELAAYFEKYPEVPRHAKILRNQVKNMGTHAGGVIISDQDLTDKIPLLYDKPGDDDRKVISAWAESGSAQELSSVGLVKFDLLGLNNLPILAETADWIEKTTGKRYEKEDIPVDDHRVITAAAKKDMTGIFQFENPMTRKIANAVEINSLWDIAAVTSLIRPGPMGAMVDGKKMPFAYAARKHGVAYEIPQCLKGSYLDKSYGLIIFQESCMIVSKLVAGFTGPMANKLRKACSKKKADLMAWAKKEFFKGAQKRIDNGEMTKAEVEQLFQNIETQAGYAFNASHATTYGMVTSAELWLKYKYPVQYFTALLNNTDLSAKKMGQDKVFSNYLDHVRKQGISVKPVDVNESKVGFATDGESIYFGLGHVKGVGSSADEIVKGQPYESFEDFMKRCKVNSRVVKGILYADGFRRFGNRDEIAEKIWELGASKESSEPTPEEAKSQLAKLVGEVEAASAAGDFAVMQEKVKLVAKLNRIAGKKPKKEQPKRPNGEPECHTDEEWEKLELEYTGVVLSRIPMFVTYAKEMAANEWLSVSELCACKKKQAYVLGWLKKVEFRTSKAGKEYHFATIDDGICDFKFFIFAASWSQFESAYKEGDIGVFPLRAFGDPSEKEELSRCFDERGSFKVLGRKE